MKKRLKPDICKTAELINDYGEIQCGCSDCQYYYHTLSRLPEKARKYFDSLGIDLSKIRDLEIMNEKGCCGMNETTMFYSGFFPATGQLSDEGEISDEWTEIIFDNYIFRVRYEFLTTGELIICVECDFPLIK